MIETGVAFKATADTTDAVQGFSKLERSIIVANQAYALMGSAIGTVQGKMNEYMGLLEKAYEFQDMLSVATGAGMERLENFIAATAGQIDIVTSMKNMNLLMQGDLQMTGDQMEVIGKAAVILGGQLGKTNEEVMSKITSAIAKGSVKSFKSLGIQIADTGDKMKNSQVIVEELTKRYGGLTIEVEHAADQLKKMKTEKLLLDYMQAQEEGLQNAALSWKAFTDEYSYHMMGLLTLQGSLTKVEREMQKHEKYQKNYLKLSNEEATAIADIEMGLENVNFLRQQENLHKQQADQFGTNRLQELEDLKNEDSYFTKLTADAEKLRKTQDDMMQNLKADTLKMDNLLKMKITDTERDSYYKQIDINKKAMKELGAAMEENKKKAAAYAKEHQRVKDRLDELSTGFNRLSVEQQKAARETVNFWNNMIDKGIERLTGSKAWGMLEKIFYPKDVKPEKAGGMSETEKMIQDTKRAFQAAADDPELMDAFEALYGSKSLQIAIERGKIKLSEEHKIAEKLRQKADAMVEEQAKNEEEITRKLEEETEKRIAMSKRYTDEVIQQKKDELKAITDTEEKKKDAYKKYLDRKDLSSYDRSKKELEDIKKAAEKEADIIAQIQERRTQAAKDDPMLLSPIHKILEDEQDRHYGVLLDKEKSYNEKSKELKKAQLENLKKQYAAFVEAGSSLIQSLGSASVEAMMKSDEALKREGTSRKKILQKALHDEMENIAKQAAVKALMEGAMAVASLAIGDNKGASQHGAAAGMYAAVALMAGATAKATSSWGSTGTGNTNDSKGASATSVSGSSKDKAGDVYNISFGNGVILGTRDEVAIAVTESIESAKARGKL